MASFHNLPIPDLLRDARDLYTNVRDDAEVFAALSADPWEFTAADFDAGLALVAAVEVAQRDEARETLEAREATASYGAVVGAVRAAYNRHRGQLRRVHRRGSPVYSALGLAGDTPDDRERLLNQAAEFYDTLADRPDVVASARGLTAASVSAAQSILAAARTAGTAQTREHGDVDRASEARKAALTELRAHAALTAGDAKTALADHPQLRERLGLLERS